MQQNSWNSWFSQSPVTMTPNNKKRSRGKRSNKHVTNMTGGNVPQNHVATTANQSQQTATTTLPLLTANQFRADGNFASNGSQIGATTSDVARASWRQRSLDNRERYDSGSCETSSACAHRSQTIPGQVLLQRRNRKRKRTPKLRSAPLNGFD